MWQCVPPVRCGRSSHDSQGIGQVVEGLGKLAPERVVLEATGGAEMTLAAGTGCLRASCGCGQSQAGAGLRPRLREAGQNRRPWNARVLAHFAEAMRPASRPLPDAAAQELAALAARRRQLVEMITRREKTGSEPPPAVSAPR